jgi:hypothetical protein
MMGSWRPKTATHEGITSFKHFETGLWLLKGATLLSMARFDGGSGSLVLVGFVVVVVSDWIGAEHLESRLQEELSRISLSQQLMQSVDHTNCILYE